MKTGFRALPHRLTVALCTLGVTVLPWVLLQPTRGMVARPKPATPAFSYLPIDTSAREMAPDDDPRAVWSPVLFSLPSPVGFSRPLLSGRAGIGAPLESPGVTRLSLAWEAPAPAPLVPERIRLEALDPSLGTPRPPVRLPPAAALQVLRQSGFGGADAPQMPLPDPARLGLAGWETEALIEADELGTVHHVLLNPPPPAEDARQLVQSLYRWRFAPGSPGQRVAYFTYRGAAEARVDAPALNGETHP